MPIRVNLPDGSVANFPDGTPPAEMEKAIADHGQQAGTDWSMASTVGGMAGGIGGFLLGGPVGAIAGAGVGGALGEGANSYFGKEKATNAGDAGLRSITSGFGQAALEAIPQGIGRLFSGAAPRVMDAGLQRTRADRLDFPNAAKRLVNEGIIPRGNNIQNALSATEGKVTADANAYDALPWPQGGRVDPKQLASEAVGFSHQAGKVGGLGNVPGPESAEIAKLKDGYLAQNTRDRNLSETIEQKRAYAARGKYSSRPNAPTVTNNELNFNTGIADANRGAAIRLHPPLEADLTKEQDLMGALVAQKNADAKHAPPTLIGLTKSALQLQNPTVMGGAAIGLDRTGRALQSPMTPAALRLAILAALGIQ